jgi:oligoribonuclease
MRLLWTDLETTGLDHARDRILSVGLIVTTPQLIEVARFEADVWCHSETLLAMPEVVREMHEASGLIGRVRSAPPLHVVMQAAGEFVEFHGGALPAERYIAGNSVHFDRNFLQHHAPAYLTRMSHRMLDVSALRTLARAWVPGAPVFDAPKAHTPLADLERSIAELRHLQRILLRDGIGPALP